jgi:integrase
MKTFAEILPSFLSDIQIRLGEKSYRSYKGQTKVFSEWLEKNGYSTTPLSGITKEIIADFFHYLAVDRELDRPTCQKYFLNIRMVFKYAIKRNEAEYLPFDLITYPKKKEDKSAQVINPDHIKMLLPKIKEKDPQLYLAFLTEYYTFLRPGTELRLLKVGDISMEAGTIQVTQAHAKTGHKRIVTVPNQLLDLYREYDIDKADKELYVFGKHHKPDNKPCSVNMLRWRFNKVRDELGLPKGYKLYSGKHSGATALHNTNKVSLHSLMSQLGHSRLSSTQHYIKNHAGFIDTQIRDSFPSPC